MKPLLVLAASAGLLSSQITSLQMLRRAEMAGDLNTVESLLSAGLDANVTEHNGQTPLSIAMIRGEARLVDLLLAWHADPNAPMTRYLFQLRPDMTIADKRGRAPLDHAVLRKKEDAALLLLEAQPRGQRTPEFLGKTMQDAIGMDEAVVAEALLRQGIKVEEALPSGYSPLDAAAFGGASKTARILLDNGANPNASGKDGTNSARGCGRQRIRCDGRHASRPRRACESAEYEHRHHSALCRSLIGAPEYR